VRLLAASPVLSEGEKSDIAPLFVPRDSAGAPNDHVPPRAGGSKWIGTAQVCAKVTIPKGGFETTVAFVAKPFAVQTGEASVKTRFGHKTQTTPQVGQTG
jgi:hypothetical protein